MVQTEQVQNPWIVVAGDEAAPVERLARLLRNGLGARTWTADIYTVVGRAEQLLPDLVVLYVHRQAGSDVLAAVEQVARLPLWVPTVVLVDDGMAARRSAFSAAGATEVLVRPVDADTLCEAAVRLIDLRRGALDLGRLEAPAAMDESLGLLPAIVALFELDADWDACVARDEPFALVVARLELLGDIELACGPRTANVARREVVRQLLAAFGPNRVFSACRDTIAIALPGACPELGFHRLERVERLIGRALGELPIDLPVTDWSVRLASAERRSDRIGSSEALLLAALDRLDAGGIELVAA